MIIKSNLVVRYRHAPNVKTSMCWNLIRADYYLANAQKGPPAQSPPSGKPAGGRGVEQTNDRSEVPLRDTLSYLYMKALKMSSWLPTLSLFLYLGLSLHRFAAHDGYSTCAITYFSYAFSFLLRFPY